MITLRTAVKAVTELKYGMMTLTFLDAEDNVLFIITVPAKDGGFPIEKLTS